MSTVTTTKPVNVAQLAGEVGAALRVADNGTTREVSAEVAQAALQAAVDAHVPADPPPSEDARLQAQIDELTDLILGG